MKWHSNEIIIIVHLFKINKYLVFVVFNELLLRFYFFCPFCISNPSKVAKREKEKYLTSSHKMSILPALASLPFHKYFRPKYYYQKIFCRMLQTTILFFRFFEGIKIVFYLFNTRRQLNSNHEILHTDTKCITTQCNWWIHSCRRMALRILRK